MNEFDKFIREEYAKYDKHMSVAKDDEEFNKHFDKYNFFEFNSNLHVELKKPGQIFLFEIYNHDHQTISYPKIGIFLNSSTHAVEKRTKNLLNLFSRGRVRKVPITTPRIKARKRPRAATAKVQPHAFISQSK